MRLFVLLFFIFMMLSPPVEAAAPYPTQQNVIMLSGTGTSTDDLVIPSSQVAGYTWITVQLYGDWTGGTVTFEASNDISNGGPGWQPISLGNMACTSACPLSTATVNGMYSGPKGAAIYFRVRLSAPGMGTVKAFASFSGLASGWASGSGTTNSCQAPEGIALTSVGNPVLGLTAFNATASPYSVPVGADALASVTTELYATAVGSQALTANTTGQHNTAVGFETLTADTTGGNNTALGYQACQTTTTGSGNICIGSGVSVAAAGTSSSLNVGNLLKGDMTSSTAASQGPLKLTSVTAGVNGIEIAESVTTAHVPIKGVGADTDITLDLVPKGAGNVNLLTGKLYLASVNGLSNDSPNRNISVGDTALSTTVSQAGGGANGSGDIGIGYHALNAVTTGNKNVAAGAFALALDTTGMQNTALGHAALQDNNADNNTAVGFQSGLHATGATNTLLGYNVAPNASFTGASNTIVGAAAATVLTSGASNTILGKNVASTTLTTGGSNILIGTSNAVDTVAAGTNSALNIGNLLKGDMTSSGAASNGALFLQSVGTGVNGIEIDETATGVAVPIKAIGETNVSLNLVPKGTGNTNLLTGRLLAASVNAYFMDSTNRNMMVGDTLGYGTVSQSGGGSNGSGDIGIGYHALSAVTTGYKNVAAGSFALALNTTGIQNTALGHSALQDNNADNNTAVGYVAGFHATGGNNSILGYNTASNASFSGTDNLILGAASGNAMTTGHNNIVLGRSAASTTLATGVGNIVIGTTSSTDTAASGTNHQLNIENSITGTLAVGTNPSICAIGMKCVLGQLRTANFNSTADQAVVIGPMTSGNINYLSTATKYVPDEIWVTNCSASLTTAKGALYTATSKGGTIIGATTTPFTGCTGATTLHKLQALTNMDTNTFTSATLYLSLTTAQGGAATGDLYVVGTPIN